MKAPLENFGPAVLARHKQRGLAILILNPNSESPPSGDLHAELTLIGYILGYPLHLSMLHRIDRDGNVTGHARTNFPRIGRFPRRLAGAVPFSRPLSRIDFFNAVMSLVKDTPDKDELVYVPIGLHFESKGRSVESSFLHSWIAIEALVVRASRSTVNELADQGAWKTWVNSNSGAIRALANPGCEEALLGAIRQSWKGKVSKVNEAFLSLGIGWTSEMDDVGAARGDYVHEGSPGGSDHPTPLRQIELMYSMLVALYAKLSGYKGPISDYGAPEKSPSWWPNNEEEASAQPVIISAPVGGER